jgi:dipeptide/tripeptide permease
VGTVHAVGGVISMALAGQLVVRVGYDATFLTLASVAALGAVLFWLTMPETRGATAVTAGRVVTSPAE